jgi:hypothetical protein
MLPLLILLALQTPDSLAIQSIPRPPRPDIPIDSASLGTPQVRIPTGQGSVLVWLLRAADTVFLAASIPDTTPYWGDDLVLSFDTDGDAASSPQHDDFQLYFRRVLDSSVVFRGRNGRWQAPRDDPDWRLGAERAGGGWEISARDSRRGWCILVRLDPAWFAGNGEQWSRMAIRVYDDAPSGWFSWPAPAGPAPGSSVERTPALWTPVR